MATTGVDYVQLGRYISSILRGLKPRYGLTIELGGWARISELIPVALRNWQGESTPTAADILAVLENGQGNWYELDGEWVRSRLHAQFGALEAFRPAPPPLYLATAISRNEWRQIRRHGLRPAEGPAVLLTSQPERAMHFARRRWGAQGFVLLIDALAMHEDGFVFLHQRADDLWAVEFVPTAYVLNRERPLRLVLAGGGILHRWRAGRLEVLLLKRKGIWDLPKGKMDPTDPTIEYCTLREVKEEVGDFPFLLGRYLTSSQHVYSHGEHLILKTTYWYVMTSPVEEFPVGHNPKVTEYRWAPLEEAIEMVGFDTLREVLRRAAAALSLQDGLEQTNGRILWVQASEPEALDRTLASWAMSSQGVSS